MFTEKFKSLAANKFFEKIVILVILISAFMIGLSTYSVPEWIENFIYFFDISITVFFAIEIFIRFKSYNKVLNFFKNGWNIFDLLIVIGSLIPLDGSETVFLGRLLRIVRVLRLVSFLPELRTLVAILYRALPKIGNIVLLMFILFYIYGGFGSLLFAEINPSYWGDISIAMLTLFRVLTLENWSEVMYETMSVYPISWIYYVSFIFITVFALINMMVGVVVDEFLTNTESKLIGKLENNQQLMRDNQQLMRDNQQKIISSQDKIRKKLDGIEKKLNGDL
tara:strand:- start:23 stop:862 length:840 start_codon:yes stop_codon:yes gene_type:complete